MPAVFCEVNQLNSWMISNWLETLDPCVWGLNFFFALAVHWFLLLNGVYKILLLLLLSTFLLFVSHSQIFYYSVSIFETIGLAPNTAKWANLGCGCLNLFVAFFTPYLMEKVNRRPLMLISCTFCSIFLAFLSVFYIYSSVLWFLPALCIVALFGYIIFYQIGLGKNSIYMLVFNNPIKTLCINFVQVPFHISQAQNFSKSTQELLEWEWAVYPRGFSTSSSEWLFRFFNETLARQCSSFLQQCARCLRVSLTNICQRHAVKIYPK